MISRVCALLLNLSVVLVIFACAEEPITALQGTVSWVYDGDTLEIDPVGKVRLIGIDTPERKNSKRDQYLIKQGVSAARQRDIYRAAKEFNIQHVKGEAVTLELGDEPRDRHDRLLAYVLLPDGQMLNRVLLENGLAVVYRRFDYKMKEDFLAAEAAARKNKVGIWAVD